MRSRGIRTHVIDEGCRSPVVCGLVIGDRDVCWAIARVNFLGSGYVHLLRGERTPLERRRHFAVESRDLGEALVSCWEQLDRTGGAIDVAYVVACVPAEACRARQATVKLDLEKESADSRPRGVRSDDLRLLEERACAEVLEPGFTVVDLEPVWYETDTGARLIDPLGAPTRTLRLHARLVLGEERTVFALLDVCRRVGIGVDALLSPFTVTGGHLRNDETDGRVLIVEVDAWQTTVSVHEQGQWMDGRTVDGGWHDVREAVLRECGLDRKDLEIWLDDKECLFRAGDFNERIPWPWRGPMGRRIETLADLFPIVEPPAQSLRRAVQKTIESLGKPGGAFGQKTIVMGDDPLSLWSLVRVWPSSELGGCEWRIPERVYGCEFVRLSNWARMVGLLRRGIRSIRKWQPALDSYRASAGDPFHGSLADAAREVFRRWVRTPRDRSIAPPRVSSPRIPWGGVLS